MDDISVEKKLQLIQQIRSQYHKNKNDLSNRERILYGKNTIDADYFGTDSHKEYFETSDYETKEHQASLSESLKMRFALAAILLFFAILFDLVGIKPGGMEMQQVFEVVAEDSIENVKDFAATMTYNMEK